MMRRAGSLVAATYDELEHLFSANESDSLHARPRCAAAFICERIIGDRISRQSARLALKHAKHVCIPVYGSCFAVRAQILNDARIASL